ncbi:MAG: bifunctional DNA-formamidopyrimidine glycosylase/DNA-(apurinic or apyrimidinic site) lyase [Patescibacteria group bacterium]
MPELPEVETVVRGLSRHIVGQKIKTIHVLTKTSFSGLPVHKSIGLLVKSVSRRGKGIIIELAKPGVARKGEDGSNSLSLLIHLKMTGQLIWVPPIRRRSKSYGGHQRLNFGHPTDDFTNSMPSRHTRVWFELTPKGAPSGQRHTNYLYFNDMRRFGWVKLTPTAEISKDKFFSKLGLEPFDKNFTPAFLYTAIQHRPKSNIKAIILDQTLVTGIGNIYSDEALFYAGIKPTRLGRSITKANTTKLVSAIKKVLTKGIKYSGTSINTHRTPEGSMGQMQNYLAVYDRKGQPCRKCKTPIIKIRVASRGTHYCPSCQL